MLKDTPKKKPTITAPTRKTSTPTPETQNFRPIPFNTKGYFTSDQPYDPEYLKIKQEVFKKYRKSDAELVFIDPKLTKPAAFIQRGMLKPNNHIYNHEGHHTDKLLNNFLKNYIHRKEKRESQDQERFFGKKRDVVADIQSNSALKSARPVTRSVYSRISTARSICSSNKEN